MSDRTAIEWTDATWNTIGGCTRVDKGCKNCYAEVMAARFNGPGQWGEGLAQIVTSGGKADHRWTGKVTFREAALTQPLRWRKPRRIFVNSTADTFHESVPDEWIDRIFAVMALCPQHTFQVLTKRPERARAYLTYSARWAAILPTEILARGTDAAQRDHWPLPNVWLGTSISDQASADLRIPELLACPAAVRFVSAEPLLGPVDLLRVRTLDSVRSAFPSLVSRLQLHMHPHIINGAQIEALGSQYQATTYYQTPDHMGGIEVGSRYYPRLDWVIVGGESGPGARPMHPDWARSLRDQCVAAEVPFFFKQWGEWGHALHMQGVEAVSSATSKTGHWAHPHRYRIHGGPEDGQCFQSLPEDHLMMRVGKARAGRLLDGREWNQMPGGAA